MTEKRKIITGKLADDAYPGIGIAIEVTRQQHLNSMKILFLLTAENFIPVQVF